MIPSTLIPSLFAAATLAASSQPAPAERCSDPQYRQFDFFVGDWEVRDAAGAPQGLNLVTRDLGGCAIHEQWTSLSDDQWGASTSAYDFRTHGWIHVWFDSWGNQVILRGGLKDGAMLMEGERLTPDGKRALERTRWTPSPGGLHQLWDYSLDGGKTWKVRFDAFYTRRGATH